MNKNITPELQAVHEYRRTVLHPLMQAVEEARQFRRGAPVYDLLTAVAMGEVVSRGDFGTEVIDRVRAHLVTERQLTDKLTIARLEEERLLTLHRQARDRARTGESA